MDNSNNNNHFISPNHFGRLFYEDNSNDENESVTNNTDSTDKTLLNDQINKENFIRKYNNNDNNKNTGRPEVVINQYPEKRFIHVNVLSLEQILIVKHGVTLKQTVAT